MALFIIGIIACFLAIGTLINIILIRYYTSSIDKEKKYIFYFGMTVITPLTFHIVCIPSFISTFHIYICIGLSIQQG